MVNDIKTFFEDGVGGVIEKSLVIYLKVLLMPQP
jgi:hypothetical protein